MSKWQIDLRFSAEALVPKYSDGPQVSWPKPPAKSAPKRSQDGQRGYPRRRWGNGARQLCRSARNPRIAARAFKLTIGLLPHPKSAPGQSFSLRLIGGRASPIGSSRLHEARHLGGSAPSARPLRQVRPSPAPAVAAALVQLPRPPCLTAGGSRRVPLSWNGAGLLGPPPPLHGPAGRRDGVRHLRRVRVG